MADIKLTDLERLLLANQYEILGLLSTDEDYTSLAKQLRDGHEWLYSQRLHISENLPQDQAEHVTNILKVYGCLKSSYDALEDKSGIDPDLVIFPGFDGNNEGELLWFSQALADADRFVAVLGKDAPNSHMPTTGTYTRMIEKWTELGRPHHPMSKETIQDILHARITPGSSLKIASP